MDVPDAEEIKNQFMDKLTSKLENFFDVDESLTLGGEGASISASTELSLIDTTDDQNDNEGGTEGN